MADFDFTSLRQEIWTISQQNLPCFEFFFKIDILLENFWGKIYPVLEYSGKKYTQENGTSPGIPT